MNSGLSQWIVSVKAGTHLSNVNQIEAGHQEPRVHVAVRLVAACDVDLNSFFSKLTEEMKLCTSSERIAPYLFESLKAVLSITERSVSKAHSKEYPL